MSHARYLCTALQEAQKLHGEVVWQIDRLAVDLADARRDVQQLSAQARVSGSQRTVGDVDADMEALENQRTALEREKDTAMRKLERLRFAPLKDRYKPLHHDVCNLCQQP